MITLHTFGTMFGIPDPSPFVTKADVLLKMSGLPYRTVVGDLRHAPKGKLPYIEDSGVKIGDSTLIRLHLESSYRIEFDAQLSAADKGAAWALDKMLEDHLYWALLRARWIDDINFRKGPAHFFDSVPALMRPLVIAMVRREVRRNLHGQGLGRHSDTEVAMLAHRAIDALAAMLGERPYLFGAHRCGADATALAFIVGVLAPYFETPLRTHAEKHSNLVAYRDRLMHEFYPPA